jgi:hypothetical protein
VATASVEGDYWAGYRFTPRLIAPTQATIWVMDDHLPLLVAIDPAGGEIASVRPVGGQRQGSPRGAHALLAAGGAVWIRWNDGVTRLDPLDGSERWLPVSAASLAAGDAGVWALAGDGSLLRIDPGGGDYLILGEPELRRHTIAVGHAAVWTLTWTSVPGGSTLSRIDPSSGRATGQLAIEGSPRRLLLDRTAVWVRVRRHGAGEAVDELLVRVDPAEVQPSAEIGISPAGSGGPVRDGVLWASNADPYASEQRGAPSTVRRIDAATGDLLGVTEVPGRVSSMVSAPGGVWGCLERHREAAPAVIELAADGVSSRVFELGGVDVSAQLPARKP